MVQTEFVPLPQSLQHQYTGGHTVIYGGYVYELCPNHPNANPWGFVAQHRLIVERILGRFLLSSEQIHHIDLNPLNNSPENLVVLSRAEHRSIHCKIDRDKKYPPLTEDIVREALQNGGLKAAAHALGVSTGTIRNQFPHLYAPYKRKSPAILDDPAWVEKLRVLAADEKIGYREAASALGISAESIAHILKRNNIPWVRKSRVGEIHKTYTRRHKKPSHT